MGAHVFSLREDGYVSDCGLLRRAVDIFGFGTSGDPRRSWLSLQRKVAAAMFTVSLTVGTPALSCCLSRLLVTHRVTHTLPIAARDTGTTATVMGAPAGGRGVACARGRCNGALWPRRPTRWSCCQR